MSRRDIQNSIDSLYSKIATYESNIKELDAYKSDISTDKTATDTSVADWNTLYDMSKDNKWKGNKKDSAETIRATIETDIKAVFRQEDKLMEDIDSIIQIYKDKIQACRNSIASLEIDLANARAAEAAAAAAKAMAKIGG